MLQKDQGDLKWDVDMEMSIDFSFENRPGPDRMGNYETIPRFLNDENTEEGKGTGDIRPRMALIEGGGRCLLIEFV